MKRRDFILKTAATSTLTSITGFGSDFFEKSDVKKITILHTNDVHSHIDAFEASHPRNPNGGGVAKRAAVVSKIRSEETNVLLLDAGDIFQGTPYFNYYGGELEFKLMSMMGYDVATLGNHDFDNGIDGLYAQLPHAKFEFVSANYNFTNTILNESVKPYTIKEKDGIRIGIFGLGIELKGLVDPGLYKETFYNDPIETAKEITRILKEQEKCDMVICLSHLGYKYKSEPEKICDVLLAQKTKDIDLIIGGHTHTFLDKPMVFSNLEGKSVLVNQVGCYGINLGRIDFYFSKDKKYYNTTKKIEII